jgi:hypothetical protein
MPCQGQIALPACGMRLFQDQIYQKGDRYIRIVRLDRYQVEFKAPIGDPKGEAEIQTLAKKEFCRLLKGMTLRVPVKKDLGDD